MTVPELTAILEDSGLTSLLPQTVSASMMHFSGLDRRTAAAVMRNLVIGGDLTGLCRLRVEKGDPQRTKGD